jgi:predicted DNA-binding protein with PD1-like motif
MSVKSALGTVGRMASARILPNTDILEGIEEVCHQYDIKYGVVHCIGSFRKVGYQYLEINTNSVINAAYGDIISKPHPTELLSATGIICQCEGKYDIHMHAVLCDTDGKISGGHLSKGQNIALTTIDTVIIEAQGMEMLRIFDENTGFYQFSPRSLQ